MAPLRAIAVPHVDKGTFFLACVLIVATASLVALLLF
jgi:hypothetical protein